MPLREPIYPFVLWDSKTDVIKHEGDPEIPRLRIVRNNPETVTFEKLGQDSMGADAWLPLQDGALVLFACIQYINRTADKVSMQGWLPSSGKDG